MLCGKLILCATTYYILLAVPRWASLLAYHSHISVAPATNDGKTVHIVAFFLPAGQPRHKIKLSGQLAPLSRHEWTCLGIRFSYAHSMEEQRCRVVNKSGGNTAVETHNCAKCANRSNEAKRKNEPGTSLGGKYAYVMSLMVAMAMKSGTS